jgi:hypothetical protein
VVGETESRQLVMPDDTELPDDKLADGRTDVG